MKPITIDHRSKTPFDAQIAHLLRQRILRGELYFGMALPDVKTLAEQHQIDVSILQSAVSILVKEGKLKSENGQYFVSHNIITKQYFDLVTPLVDLIKQHYNVNPTIKTLILNEHERLPNHLHDIFNDTHAIFTRRIYSAGNRNLVVLDAYFPRQRFLDVGLILKKNQPYYRDMMKHYNFTFANSKTEILGLGLSRELAKLLHATEGQACYCYTGLTTDNHGQLVEYTYAYGLPEIMRFNLNKELNSSD